MMSKEKIPEIQREVERNEALIKQCKKLIMEQGKFSVEEEAILDDKMKLIMNGCLSETPLQKIPDTQRVAEQKEALREKLSEQITKKGMLSVKEEEILEDEIRSIMYGRVPETPLSINITAELNKKFIAEIFLDKGKNSMIWKTPYGVDFIDNGSQPHFYFLYNENLNGLYDDTEESRYGCIHGNDLYEVLKQLETNPNKLRIKPESVVKLQNALKINACRKTGIFGSWHLAKKNNYSMFNNPFSIKYCGSTTSDEYFELYFYKTGKCEEYITVTQILQNLSKNIRKK